MPLLDHFHAPLYPKRYWESFHAQFASAIASTLNSNLLPQDYFAEIQVHIGPRIEVDVATLHDHAEVVPRAEESAGGVATLAVKPWAPPKAEFSMPAIYPDVAEVQVYGALEGKALVAAIELVSPGNKDRDEERRGFAAKCAAYLQQGIGLIIVDIVTTRKGNLHNELVQLLGVGEKFLLGSEELYATAYRPIRRPRAKRIDVWNSELGLGKALPLLPLALDRDIVLPLDLEPPYMEACQRSRLI